jgi:hypothetical protein
LLDGSIPDFVKNNQEALDNFKANNIQPNNPQAGIANWTPWGQANPPFKQVMAKMGLEVLEASIF